MESRTGPAKRPLKEDQQGHDPSPVDGPSRDHSTIDIGLAVEHPSVSDLPIDVPDDSLRMAVRAIIRKHGPPRAVVSVALVDDPTIHELNQRFLQHDYPTDVLSFVLEKGPDHLDGEVIVSLDTAIRCATEYGWPAENELLLYVVHGTLHLVGFDDQNDEQRRQMRAGEHLFMAQLGRALPPEEPRIGSLPEGMSP